MPNNLSAHVASIIASVVAVLGVLHPGMHVSAAFEQRLVTIAVPSLVVLVTVLQAFHINLKKEWLKGYNAFQLGDQALQHSVLVHAVAAAQAIDPSLVAKMGVAVDAAAQVVVAKAFVETQAGPYPPAQDSHTTIADGSGAPARPQ